MLFSDKEKIDTFNPPTESVLKFLAELYQCSIGYSAINTAKSAISSICALVNARDIGNEVLVKRFMKGIFTNRPNLPRYGKIWDVNIVFKHILLMSENGNLSLLQLSEKLTMLLMLLSGQRGQTIHLLKLKDIQINDNRIVCYISDLVKQSKPGKHVEPLMIDSFNDNKKLCVVTTMKDYITRTEPLRGHEQRLFISSVPPHKAVSKSTIARWLKALMGRAGVDISVYASHSCRAASASAAAEKGLQINKIMQAAGWSSEKTFQTYYQKIIDKNSYSSVILSDVMELQQD